MNEKTTSQLTFLTTLCFLLSVINFAMIELEIYNLLSSFLATVFPLITDFKIILCSIK